MYFKEEMVAIVDRKTSYIAETQTQLTVEHLRIMAGNLYAVLGYYHSLT
jgi:hypothetical protein